MPDELNISQETDLTIVTFATQTVLDLATSDDIARKLLALASAPPTPRVLIDFHDVGFLASRMLGVLVDLTRKAQAVGGSVVLCGLKPELRGVFQVTRLERLLKVVEDPDKAKALLRSGASA